MTPSVQNTALLWLFAGMTVVGAYCAIVLPVLAVFRYLRCLRTPQPPAALTVSGSVNASSNEIYIVVEKILSYKW